MAVTASGVRAPAPPSPPRLHDSKLYGLRMEGDVQSDAEMALVVADMLPAGQALTAVASFSSVVMLGQKYPIGQGEHTAPCILVPGRQISGRPADLGSSTH